MSRCTMMLTLALGGSLALAACSDRDSARTAADEARSDAGERGLPGDAVGTHPDGTVATAPGPGLQQAERGNATLAMSGTPSSHLVDGAGSAVYVLAGNTDGSRCDAVCEEVWPPVLAHDAQPTAGPGVEAPRIGTLPRDGRTHVTYGGEPLYRYSGDAGADRTTGAGVEDQWGKWSLVGLDGEALPDPH